MNIVSEKEYMIFRKDFNNIPVYKIGISKKDRNKQYINGYLQCKFKKGTELQDKTKIVIKKAWIDFYLKEKQTIPVIFISEFEKIEKNVNDMFNKISYTTEDIDNLPEDLPF